MAARLRLPRSMPLEEKMANVEELLNRLGLAKVREKRTGRKGGTDALAVGTGLPRSLPLCAPRSPV